MRSAAIASGKAKRRVDSTMPKSPATWFWLWSVPRHIFVTEKRCWLQHLPLLWVCDIGDGYASGAIANHADNQITITRSFVVNDFALAQVANALQWFSIHLF
jgi:hypothetical protein